MALADRHAQLGYIADRNPRAAIRVGDAIESAIALLEKFPHAGRPGRVAGTRELVIADTPYLAAYRIEAEAVVVLRLLHHAQRWPDGF